MNQSWQYTNQKVWHANADWLRKTPHMENLSQQYQLCVRDAGKPSSKHQYCVPSEDWHRHVFVPCDLELWPQNKEVFRTHYVSFLCQVWLSWLHQLLIYTLENRKKLTERSIDASTLLIAPSMWLPSAWTKCSAISITATALTS